MTLLFLLACSGGPAATSSTAAGPALAELGTVPEFELLDQTGTPVTKANLVGSNWLGNFMFTSCPDICPGLSTRMAAVAAHYEKVESLKFVSFSVDPGVDTPPVLAQYGARFGAKHPTWRFLTGDVDAMKRVVVDGFKLLMQRAPGDAGRPETVLHGSRFVLVDARGDIRAYPDPDVPGEIEAYVDLLLKEASR